MTTISASGSGPVDLLAFGLAGEELASLRALADSWAGAVKTVFAASGDKALPAGFVARCAGLAGELGDPVWQEAWLRDWQKLSAQGYPTLMLFSLLNGAFDACEGALLGDGRPVPRLHVELLAVLRRGVLSVLSCAADLIEEATLQAEGMPGELAALRYLWECASRQQRLAVLSVSVVNRDAFVHLSAADLQSLPGLLANRLGQLLRSGDRLFAGREGEWLLVLPNIRSMTQPALAGAYVQRDISRPFRLASGTVLYFDVAIGAAALPDHGNDPEAILAASRIARWHLAGGRESFAWFEPAMQADWQRRFALAGELKTALAQETLELHLQPQIEMGSGRCVGAELLLRWRQSNGDWADPQLTMEIVDENGWRSLYTDWMFRYALRLSGDLAAAGIELRLALNLTADDLVDEDLVDMIAQRLETWQIGGECFTLELTESAMLASPERAREIFSQLRQLGFRLALDDFGTGYSSLSHLVSLPIDELKIDRSFIVAMMRSPEHRRVVRTIVDLARDLDMLPLAEGVESEAQAEMLQQMGCRRIQGYLHAEAMPEAAFIDWFRHHDA
ncbi:MAG: EAL domain-containing protein [Dechloromonas sp.]|nr:MAG: EAL domain-containing protein [Dechloromonas sp.]